MTDTLGSTTMSNHEKIDTYGVFGALSVASRPYKGDVPQDKPRQITCMRKKGSDDDKYGGWSQEETLRGVERLTLPDGTEPEHGETPAFGYDDDKSWAIIVVDESEGHYRIEEYDGTK